MVLGNFNGRSLVSRDQFGLDYLGALLIRKFINYAASIVYCFEITTLLGNKKLFKMNFPGFIKMVLVV